MRKALGVNHLASAQVGPLARPGVFRVRGSVRGAVQAAIQQAARALLLGRGRP